MRRKITTTPIHRAILLFVTAFSLVASTGLAEKTPNEVPETTNDLAEQSMAHIRTIFEIVSSANSPKTAQIAAKKIKIQASQLATLTPLLIRSATPSEEEMRAFAKTIYSNNNLLKDTLQRVKLLQQTNSERTNSIIKQAMDEATTKTKELTTTINKLYPKDLMKKFIDLEQKEPTK